VADVDPDDGPFVNPPIELITGLSNVIILIVFESSILIVTSASSNVFKDDADLHFIVVAAIHMVVSHLMKNVTVVSFGDVLFLSYLEPPAATPIEVSENP
jgi:hypothetical protein